MVTTVYLIRHGRTALNAAGVLRGRIDEPLDAAGQSEASRLASLFASIRLNQVVSSPLKRSLETARAIAEPHGLPVTVDAAFADRDYGPWAGKSQEEVEARYGSVDETPPNEVEPRAQFEHRVVTAIETVVAQSQGKIVAIVGHEAVNRALIRAVIEAWPKTGAYLLQPTGCWNRLAFDARGAICDVVGAVPGDGAQP